MTDGARMIQAAVVRADLLLCALARLPWGRLAAAGIGIVLNWRYGQ